MATVAVLFIRNFPVSRKYTENGIREGMVMRLSCLYDDPKVKAVLESAERSDAERLGRLTPKQLEVLPQIVDGQSTKMAAHTIGISPRTLEQHRKEIMDRTGCKTFAELVRLFARAG